MLRAMRLATQWRRIQAELPDDWVEARLAFTVSNPQRLERATALLAPLQPGRAGQELRFVLARRGAGPSPAAFERALRRLVEARIGGELRLTGATEAPPAVLAERGSAADAWENALEALPADWTDVYGEIELTSSDHLDPAAIALAPLNPSRFGATPTFRFRCARRFGYGTAPQMVRRCLLRLDERGLPADVRILYALSDTQPVATQGPVWYLGGKVV
jgi:hypothetical protein